MANKISTGTLISSNGIIDFLVNYGDENKTPCPRNYVNGNLFSGTGNTANYIYSNQESVVTKNFFGVKWYTVDQTWSKFCKNSYPVTSGNLKNILSSDIANWDNFKNIVISSFIPLTNIRYCKFTNSDYSISSANIFLTDASISGTHTTFKDLFMNNTSGKTIISSVVDFLSCGEISSEYVTLASSAGPGKLIKSGWDGGSDESLNRLLLLCVKALNTIRTKLSCTFTDEMYNLKFQMQDDGAYTNLRGVKTVDISLSGASYTTATFNKSPLYPAVQLNNTYSSYYDKISWYLTRATNNADTKLRYNPGETIDFNNLFNTHKLVPSDFIIRPRLEYKEIKSDPQLLKINYNSTLVEKSGTGILGTRLEDNSNFTKLSTYTDLSGTKYNPYDLIVAIGMHHFFMRDDYYDTCGVLGSDGNAYTCRNSERYYSADCSMGGKSWNWGDRMGDNRGTNDDGDNIIIFKPNKLEFKNKWTFNQISSTIVGIIGREDEEKTITDITFGSSAIRGLTLRTKFGGGTHRCYSSRGCPDVFKHGIAAMHDVAFPNYPTRSAWTLIYIGVVNPNTSVTNISKYF